MKTKLIVCTFAFKKSYDRFDLSGCMWDLLSAFNPTYVFIFTNITIYIYPFIITFY